MLGKPTDGIPTSIGRRDELNIGTPNGPIQYGGGAVIGNAQFNPIYWSWNSSSHPELPELQKKLTNFLTDFAVSPYLQNLDQYSTNATRIGTGTCTPGMALNGSPPSANVDPDDVRNIIAPKLIEEAVAKGAPVPNADSLYVIYGPPGTVINENGTLSTGMHGLVGNGRYAGTSFAFLPYPSAKVGLLKNGTVFDQLTSSTAHECVEEITDKGANGWMAGVTYNGVLQLPQPEIADVCQTKGQRYDGALIKGALVELYANRDGNCYFYGGGGAVQNLTYDQSQENSGAQHADLGTGAKAGIGVGGILLGGAAILAATWKTPYVQGMRAKFGGFWKSGNDDLEAAATTRDPRVARAKGANPRGRSSPRNVEASGR